MMEYQGYLGKVEFDDEASLFHGEVINTRDVITFQGKSVAELKRAFRDSVDDYLAFCAERGEEPDRPFSGQFLTRVSPELHRRVNVAASLAGKSLNAWVAEQLQDAVNSESAATVGPSRNGPARKAAASGKPAVKRTRKRSR
jgi:predicted HicB family RNase H-like nuclease